MPVSAATPPDASASGLQTEAEGVINMLSGFGFVPAINLSDDQLFFALSQSDQPRAAAVHVASVLDERFREDQEFREQAISYIGTCGYYLADAPGINESLKFADPATLIKTVRSAGLTPLAYVSEDGVFERLLFLQEFGRPAANVHLLVDLINSRVRDEPEFRSVAYAYLLATKATVVEEAATSANPALVEVIKNHSAAVGRDEAEFTAEGTPHDELQSAVTLAAERGMYKAFLAAPCFSATDIYVKLNYLLNGTIGDREPLINGLSGEDGQDIHAEDGPLHTFLYSLAPVLAPTPPAS